MLDWNDVSRPFAVCYRDCLQMGASIMGAVLSVLYAARNGLMDCEVRH